MPTVASLQTALQAQLAPGDNTELLRLLNEADLRLLEFGRWRFTRSRLDLTPVSDVVTLPITHVAILGARVDELPVDIRAEEHEYVPGGIGQVDVGGSGSLRLIDQGLTDAGLRYYKVVGTASDDDDYTLHTLSTYAPFSLYLAADPPDPLTDIDSTTTRCPSLAALKNMALGIIYEEASDNGRARSYIADALRILDSHEGSARGHAKTPMNIRPNGPGIRGIASFT